MTKLPNHLGKRQTQGLIFLIGGVVLLLLAYFRNFLSLVIILAALAAIIYGAMRMNILPEKVQDSIDKIKHKK